MKWKEHVALEQNIVCQTPIGIFEIAKDLDMENVFNIKLDDKYIDHGNTLCHAKDLVYKYLHRKRKELTEFLK